MKDVDGKTAFITGGASGIGFGMAQAFLKAGMKVVMADVRQDHLDEAATVLKGSNLPYHFIQLDVTDRDAMARAADEVERVFGKVHVVCNNAGVGGNAPMEEAEYEDWDWVVGVNFGGVVNGVKTFVPRIRAHGEGGHIVNTSSMAGIIPLTSQGGIYAASKFAVRGLTDSLRLSLQIQYRRFGFVSGPRAHQHHGCREIAAGASQDRCPTSAAPSQRRVVGERRDGSAGNGRAHSARHQAQRRLYPHARRIQGRGRGPVQRHPRVVPDRRQYRPGPARIRKPPPRHDPGSQGAGEKGGIEEF